MSVLCLQTTLISRLQTVEARDSRSGDTLQISPPSPGCLLGESRLGTVSGFGLIFVLCDCDMQLRKNKTGLVYNHILVVEDAQCPIFLPNCLLPLCSRLHNDTSSPRPINQQAASIRRRDPHWSIVSTVPSNVFYLYLLPLLTRCARAGWAGRELVRICMGRDEAWLLLHTEGQGLHSQPSNLPSPTSIYTCISSSSTIRYYPEICRRYSAPPNPSVAIICFRYRSARARHGSAGIYRTLEDKILQVQSSAWAGRCAGRSPLVSWSRISVSGHMPPAEDGARCTHCFRWASLHIDDCKVPCNVPILMRLEKYCLSGFRC